MSEAEDGYYDLCKSNSADGQKWISLPWTIVGAMIAYRKSWFDEIGSPAFPDTWEKYREVGRETEGQGPADRPDSWPHVRRRADVQLPLSVVVGWQ